MKNEYVDVQLGSPETERIVNGIYQYDKGLKLRLSGLDVARVVQMQFSVDGMKETLTAVAYKVEDKWVAPIPNEALSRGRNVHCYVYITDSATGITIYHIVLAVTRRPKPDAYDTTFDYTFPSLEMYAGDTTTWDISLYSERNVTFTPAQLHAFTFTLTIVDANSVESAEDISTVTPVIQKTGELLSNNDATLRFTFEYADTINLSGEYIYQIEMKSQKYCKAQQGRLTIRPNYNQESKPKDLDEDPAPLPDAPGENSGSGTTDGDSTGSGTNDHVQEGFNDNTTSGDVTEDNTGSNTPGAESGYFDEGGG